MESVADWSGLVGDLLEKIAICLAVIEDFKAFRGVCTSWRAAVAEDRYLNGGSKIPMILLPEKNGERELYSLWDRRICARVALPEGKGKRYFNVGFGWILSIAILPDGDVELLKPLSHRAKPIQLSYEIKASNRLIIKQAVLSDDPSSSNNKEVLLAMRTDYFFWFFLVSNQTSNFYMFTRTSLPSTCCCYANKLYYSLRNDGRICTWGLTGLINPLGVQVDDKNILSVDSHPYLLKSTGDDLLLISRDDKAARKFTVIRVDVARRRWQVMDDLNGDAVFLSGDSPVSVSAADFPGVLKPDCIYFITNDFQTNSNSWPNDIGIYNVRMQSFEEGFNFDTSCSLTSPPLWISP